MIVLQTWPFTTRYTMLFHNHFPWGGMWAPVQAWLTRTGIYMCIYAAHPHVQSRSKPGTDLGWVTESSSTTTRHRCSPGPWLVRNRLMKARPSHTSRPEQNLFPFAPSVLCEKEKALLPVEQGPKPDTGLRTGYRQGCGPLHTCPRPSVQDTASRFLCLHPSLPELHMVRKEDS